MSYNNLTDDELFEALDDYLDTYLPHPVGFKETKECVQIIHHRFLMESEKVKALEIELATYKKVVEMMQGKRAFTWQYGEDDE